MKRRRVYGIFCFPKDPKAAIIEELFGIVKDYVKKTKEVSRQDVLLRVKAKFGMLKRSLYLGLWKRVLCYTVKGRLI